MVDKIYFCILLIINNVGLCAFKEETYKMQLAKSWLVKTG